MSDLATLLAFWTAFALYAKVRRGMNAVLGAVLAGLGCKLLLDS